jgi:hypothetical protein
MKDINDLRRPAQPESLDSALMPDDLALGVPEGELPFTDADDDRFSLDRVSDSDAGYGYSGTDSDNNLNEAAS